SKLCVVRRRPQWYLRRGSEAAARAVARRIRKVTGMWHAALVTAAHDLIRPLLVLGRRMRLGDLLVQQRLERGAQRPSIDCRHLELSEEVTSCPTNPRGRKFCTSTGISCDVPARYQTCRRRCRA